MGKGDLRAEAARQAERAVMAVRDDPAGRLEFMDRSYGENEHWCRAERAFMEWEVRRGVLNRLDGSPPGSRWWRTVNERLLRDVEQARLLTEWKGSVSAGPVAWWMAFFEERSPRTWYRAHNASIISGYLSAAPLALRENEQEQRLMNLILMRVLYAQFMLEDGPLHPGPMSHIGKVFADPRSFGVGGIMKVPAFYPPHYPLDGSDPDHHNTEHRLGKLRHHGWAWSLFLQLVDHDVVFPRLEKLYWFVGSLLNLPRLAHLAVRSMPSYPWGALVPTDDIDRLILSIPGSGALLTELRRLALVHR